MNKSFIAGFALALMVLVGAVSYASWGSPNSGLPNGDDGISTSPGNQTPTNPSTPGTPTTLTGTIVCLPHKGDGPSTMECAFGLKASNGKYYALRNLWEINPLLTTTDIQVRVVGTLHAPETGEKYDIVGSIDVTSATQI